jgi:hypothetical protein
VEHARTYTLREVMEKGFEAYHVAARPGELRRLHELVPWCMVPSRVAGALNAQFAAPERRPSVGRLLADSAPPCGCIEPCLL